MSSSETNHSPYQGMQQQSRFRSLELSPEMVELERVLREINIWHLPEVQKTYRRARLGTRRGSAQAIHQLRQYIADYQASFIQNGSIPYYPLATEEQLTYNHQGGIHILNQIGNNIPLIIPQDELLLNTLVLGRPRGGKSSAIFYLLKQLSSVPVLVLDPKNVWRYRARDLNYHVIYPFSISLDAIGHKRPEEGLFPYLEGVAKIVGLQYGLVPLYEAGKLALQQREKYVEQTGRQTQLCLADIAFALNIVALTLKTIKRDYFMSATTALKLLLGPNNLFATRRGIPLQELINGNYILPCHKFSTIQCRFLAFCLLSYLLMASYDNLESIHLHSILVIDDSSSFINSPDNVFGATIKISFWGDLLSKLRGSGRGIIFIDQIVGSIFNDVKALCSNWMIAGGLRDTKNFSEIKAAMNLTDEQADYIGKMKERECIAFFPTHYPRPVLGTIPEVSSIDEDSISA